MTHRGPCQPRPFCESVVPLASWVVFPLHPPWPLHRGVREIRWLGFAKGSCELFLGFQVGTSRIFSCSLPGAVPRQILAYTQGAGGLSLSVSSNSSAPVPCGFSPAACSGPPFSSVSPEEASGGMRAAFPTRR